MDRSELKKDLPDGIAEVKEENFRCQYTDEYEYSGTIYVGKDLIARMEESAGSSIHLYAEAQNVAHMTGMWPHDLLQRVNELEGALMSLLNNPPSDNPTYAHMPTIQARAILNKKP